MQHASKFDLLCAYPFSRILAVVPHKTASFYKQCIDSRTAKHVMESAIKALPLHQGHVQSLEDIDFSDLHSNERRLSVTNRTRRQTQTTGNALDDED